MTTNCGCFACVQESDIAMIERCGRFTGVAQPGCHWLCCCVGYAISGVVSNRLQQLDVSCETKTHDNVFVTLRVNVQYACIPEHEHDAFYALENHTVQIRAYVYDQIRSTVPKITLDKGFFFFFFPCFPFFLEKSINQINQRTHFMFAPLLSTSFHRFGACFN